MSSNGDYPIPTNDTRYGRVIKGDGGKVQEVKPVNEDALRDQYADGRVLGEWTSRPQNTPDKGWSK